MAAKYNVLRANTVDPFDAYHSVFRDRVRWQWLCVGMLGSNAVLVVALVLCALRPPQVIVKDRTAVESPVVSIMTPEPPITAADARVFFLHMLKLRFGWDSLTVDRDLQAYLSQAFKDLRHSERAHFDEPDGVANGDDDTDVTNGALTRVQRWIRANIRNTLLLPQRLEDVSCQRTEGVWFCQVDGSLVTQSLVPPFKSVAPKTRLTFLATLLEVRHTMGTPSGLLVGAMRQIPVVGNKETN